MASRLLLDALASRSAPGPIAIETGTQLESPDVGAFVSPGGVLQMRPVMALPAAHLSTVTTVEAKAPLFGAITPRRSNSRILVNFFSSMANGSAGTLTWSLHRRIAGGPWVGIAPHGGGNNAAPYPYGWGYTGNAGWDAISSLFVDEPATTSLVEYSVNYRLQSGTAIAYMVHQNMPYGWNLTEIAP